MSESHKIFRRVEEILSSKQRDRVSLVDPQGAFNSRRSILSWEFSIFNSRSSIFHPRSSILALFLTVLLAACRQDMHDQPKYRPLRPVEQIGTINDGRSARPQVDGTVARDDLRDDVEFYTGKIAGGQQKPSNEAALAPTPSTPQPNSGMQGFVTEFPMQITAADLDTGQQRFNIYCAVCHGPLGDGGGMIPKRGFRKPPTYHDDRLRNAPVGYFFDVVTNGFGTMPDYAAQIDPADRWRIIAYIRALQLSQRGTLADVPPDKRSELDKPPEAPKAEGHEGAK
jgi:mono/diheme cytochrome c family protein